MGITLQWQNTSVKLLIVEAPQTCTRHIPVKKKRKTSRLGGGRSSLNETETSCRPSEKNTAHSTVKSKHAQRTDNIDYKIKILHETQEAEDRVISETEKPKTFLFIRQTQIKDHKFHYLVYLESISEAVCPHSSA